MKRLWVIFLNFLLLGLPVTMVWAAAGEKSPDLSKHTVKVEGLNTINHFFAVTYNENKLLFAVIVTVLMGLIGVLIAAVTDVILKVVGLEVSKIEHHE